MRLQSILDRHWDGMPLLIKFAQFSVIGASGMIVDMCLLLALNDLMHWNLIICKSIAAEVALVSNFGWNEVWTFRGLGEDGLIARIGRLWRYNVICLVGIVISSFLLQFQVSFFEVNMFIANFVSIVVASGWNFTLNARFNWRVTG